MSLTKIRTRLPRIESGLMPSWPSWFENNNLFEDNFFDYGRTLPAMNIKEKDEFFDVELAIPGFTKKEIDVSLEDDILHISGTKEKEKVEDEEGYTRREFSFDSFDRKVSLPNTIDMKKDVKATFENGLLKLRLVKTPEAMLHPVKKIAIK
jgi:HSP20 family protein